MKNQSKTKQILIQELASLRQRIEELEQSESEWKKAKDSLTKSEEKFRKTFFTSPNAINITRLQDGMNISINPEFTKITGYTEEDYIGKTTIEYNIWENIEDRQRLVARLRKDGEITNLEAAFRTKGGDIRYGLMSASIIDLDGVPHVLSITRDITDHKRAEEKLSKSEKKYRELYDFLPIPVYEMDFDANIISANRAIYETFRGTEEDLKKGFKAWQLLSPKEIEKSKKNIQELLKGKQIAGTEYNMMRLDGSVFPAIVISSVIYSDGKPVGLRGAVINITDRMQAEESLRRSEEKYRTILEDMQDGFYEVDLAGDFTSFNNSTCRIWGYPKEELMGMNNRQYTDKEDAKKLFKTFNEVYKTGQPAKELDWQIIRKDGTKRFVEASISLIKDLSGKPNGFRGIIRDVTERKQAEEALKESESKYRLLADNVNDVIFVLDMNLNYTYVSPSIKILWGYEPAEVVKQQALETLTPSSRDLAMSTLAEVMELEKSEHREINISRTLPLETIRKDGTTVWTEVKFSFIRDENQRPVGILGVTRDITERKRTEEKLLLTLESLRKAVSTTIHVLVSAVEARDSYTSGHQFRSADLARTIAMEMGLAQETIDGIRMAGSIHDIGKLSIPAEILSKPSKLTDLEFSLIKEHSRKGYEMLKDVESPWPLAQIVYQHHERMDGSGYPRNLKGDEILMDARIMAVADVVEAMASHRPYRPALDIEVALEEIEKNKGILYDNVVADACLKLFREKSYQLP